MKPNLMATKTATSKHEPVVTALLEQLAELDVKDISTETARTLLQLKFDGSQQERVSALSEKARKGTLTPVEGDELDESLRVGTLLATLQSRARQALRRPAREVCPEDGEY